MMLIKFSRKPSLLFNKTTNDELTEIENIKQ